MLVNISPAFSSRIPILVPVEAKRNHSVDPLRFQTTRLAVVTIYADQEIGSGSLVGREGLVLTNYHVVQGVMGGERSGWLSVKTSNGNRYPGRVIKFDRPHDLALIQLNAWKYFPTVPTANAECIQIGQSVFAIGSPFGCPGVLTQGTLNRIRSNGDLQSQLILQPGNSGGPLLNSHGEMIGLNRGILQTSCGSNTGISFATHAKVIRNFIEPTRSSASQTKPEEFIPPCTSHPTPHTSSFL